MGANPVRQVFRFQESDEVTENRLRTLTRCAHSRPTNSAVQFIRAALLAAAVAGWPILMLHAAAARQPESLLRTHVLVTWYGNPHTGRMGVLGQFQGAERSSGLRRQAAAYESLTSKEVIPAYHLVAVVAQPTAGTDGKWRRRESGDVIRALLDDARANGFLLILDMQPGRAAVEDELRYLRPFLEEPDVHLALDPEFDMGEGQVPGRELGHLHAAQVNAAIDLLADIRAARGLPPKVLIVHQFTLGMLPDKEKIRDQPGVDLVLDMDGFGSRALKLSTYRAIWRQRALPFAGFKLFYSQDINLFAPDQVMHLTPVPSVVIYQ